MIAGVEHPNQLERSPVSTIRRLALTLTAVGMTLLVLPRPSNARPPCASGPTFCSASSNPCPAYCQQLGWPYGLCNLQTNCCVCSD